MAVTRPAASGVFLAKWCWNVAGIITSGGSGTTAELETTTEEEGIRLAGWCGKRRESRFGRMCLPRLANDSGLVEALMSGFRVTATPNFYWNTIR